MACSITDEIELKTLMGALKYNGYHIEEHTLQIIIETQKVLRAKDKNTTLSDLENIINITPW